MHRTFVNEKLPIQANMKALLLVFSVSSFLLQASCSESESVTKDEFKKLESEMREIASTLADFMAEMRQQLKMGRSEIVVENDGALQNDTTIEERVTVLEFQMTEVTEDITGLTVEVTDLGDEIDIIDGEVAVIFADQVIQDERILELEDESEVFEDSIMNLDSIVSTIENSLIVVNDTLSEETKELDTRVTLVENTVNEMEDTVSQLDTRVTQMEVTGTVAFQADFDTYTSIPIDSVVVFDIVALNVGDGYNSATGEFTVPSGGAGLYFMYANLFAENQEAAYFNIRVNGQSICAAHADMDTSGQGDNGTPSCGVVVMLSEGDVVDVFYDNGTDDTPVDSNTTKYNSFTGFRIAPE